MLITLYKVFSKIKTIGRVIKINSFLEMEGIQLFPVLLLNTGTFPILKYFSTWCNYNIPILLNEPNLLLHKVLGPFSLFMMDINFLESSCILIDLHAHLRVNAPLKACSSNSQE